MAVKMLSRGFYPAILKVNKKTKDSFNGSPLPTGGSLNYNFSFETLDARSQPQPVATGFKCFHNTNYAFHGHDFARSAPPPWGLLRTPQSFRHLPIPDGPVLVPPVPRNHLRVPFTSFEISSVPTQVRTGFPLPAFEFPGSQKGECANWAVHVKAQQNLMAQGAGNTASSSTQTPITGGLGAAVSSHRGSVT